MSNLFDELDLSQACNPSMDLYREHTKEIQPHSDAIVRFPLSPEQSYVLKLIIIRRTRGRPGLLEALGQDLVDELEKSITDLTNLGARCIRECSSRSESSSADRSKTLFSELAPPEVLW